MNGAEIATAIFSATLGALVGTGLANFAVRMRVTKIEYELWGTDGKNGLRASVREAHAKIDRAVERELREFQRIDARNRSQHERKLEE